MRVETANKFGVGVGSGHVTITFPNTFLTKEEALNLAAWLVAMATPSPEEDFAPVLKEILNT